ncbi:MAG TPA: serine/threonine-protein phosphatase [Ruminococcus sp.]|nr:serine/threonine-protein phosphatase [Ruminococcus sp.]HCR74359.1 serine/threonine-protein phosphatase [Ruminococcus sp.]
MKFLAAADTDIGIKKAANQDSLTLKIAETDFGHLVLAVICDGMGGLSKGELASAVVIRAFSDWFENKLPKLLSEGASLSDDLIKNEWITIINNENERLRQYGMENNVRLGTTITALAAWDNHYIVMNVGDTRAYKITDSLLQITNDQTFVAREVALGRMTPEEALVSPQRNILLQCVGVTATVSPDFFCGEFESETSFMICSDGFRHLVSPQEILNEFRPHSLSDENDMRRRIRSLIELNKIRMEADNITALLVKAAD